MSGKTKQRSSKILSPTVKVLKSLSQIKHLDWFSPEHIRDVLASLLWQEQFLGNSKEYSISLEQLTVALEKAGMELPSKEQKFVQVFDEATLSKSLPKSSENTLAGNLCFEDGNWTEKVGKEWVDFILDAQKERSTYTTSSGDVKVSGKDDYIEPLKSMFVRLPPWVPLALKSSDGAKVQKVARDLAAKFSKETGMPVLAVNIHSETKHDMHLHIVFTDVVKLEETKKPNAQQRRAFLKEIRADIRTQLKSEGKPSSPQHVKKIMDEMDIDFPAAVKTGKIVWKRLLKKPDSKSHWPKVKRSTRLLGTAYRLKGQVWDAAETETDKDAVRTFREDYGSFDGSFTKRFAEVEDKEAEYMDWWMAKEYEDMMFDALSPAQKKKVEEHKKKAVADYIQYGQTVISPEQVAVKDEEAALADEKKKLKEAEKELSANQIELDASKVDLQKDKDSWKVEASEMQADLTLQRVVHEVVNEVDTAQLASKLLEAKGDGKKEVITEVLKVLPPAKSDKSLKDVLGKVSEVTNDSIILDKILPELSIVIKKVLDMKKPVKWLVRSMTNIGNIIIGKMDDKETEK